MLIEITSENSGLNYVSAAGKVNVFTLGELQMDVGIPQPFIDKELDHSMSMHPSVQISLAET